MGQQDAFIRSYDPSGNILFTKQYGGTGFDSAFGVAVDIDGAIYMCGSAATAVFGSPFGNSDTFVVKFIPEPAAVSLRAVGVLIGLLGSLIRGRRRKAEPVSEIAVNK